MFDEMVKRYQTVVKNYVKVWPAENVVCTDYWKCLYDSYYKVVGAYGGATKKDKIFTYPFLLSCLSINPGIVTMGD